MNLKNDATRCGAKTRSGAPCASKGMPNGRCRMHGGNSLGGPVGNTNAVKHGIYRASLTDQERNDFDEMELGSVDQELRLVRVRLDRTLIAERDDIRSDQDYEAIVDRLLGRIEGLERTRKKLLEESDSDEVILINPNPEC